MKVLYAVVGAGGFGREVMPIVRHWLPVWREEGAAEAVFVVEDAYSASSPKEINGHRVMSMSDFLRADAEKLFNVTIQNSRARQRIAESMPAEIRPFDVVAPNSGQYDGNTIGQGLVQCAFTQITSNVRIGRFVHLNLFSCVEHDCVIGDYVTFSPGVKCSGRVTIEDHVFVGAGAVIKDGTDKPITIGRGAVVGMGAVVTKGVPPGATVVGNPARPLER